MKEYSVAIVGATGAVGRELMTGLEERNFPLKELRLLASSRSKGKKLPFRGDMLTVEECTASSFKDIDIVLFAGGSQSKEFALDAVRAGCVVIDNSSAFRMDPEVPLVVPEVNPEDISWHKGLIANPNCSTIQMVVALKPIHDAAKIKRIIVSTYQAVSGAGKDGIEELEREVKEYVKGGIDPKDLDVEKAFPYPIAFNCIPHIDSFLEDGYTKEEMKMVNETRKMFHDDSLAINATTVRVPVFRSHSESITIETEHPISPEEAREILSKAPGIILVDNCQNKEYPMAIHSSGTNEVYVGRIRKDISSENGLSMWVVADQLRKGAATNAIQIAELIVAQDNE
ncbi:MAG TPA: aspartate-semialdehyde dehydrogenase [Firmicutes bacterium]|nr:aspartate-semialdehyde dehydrogenase [Bacillota bacterium]